MTKFFNYNNKDLKQNASKPGNHGDKTIRRYLRRKKMKEHLLRQQSCNKKSDEIFHW